MSILVYCTYSIISFYLFLYFLSTLSILSNKYKNNDKIKVQVAKVRKEWEKFEKNYNGPVKLNKKEMNDAGPELKKYNVNAFPTIIIIDENDDYTQYDGPRTSEGLLKYFSN